LKKFWLFLYSFFIFCLVTPFSFSQSKPAINKFFPNFSQLLNESQRYQSEGLYEKALQSLNQTLKQARTLEEKKLVVFNLAEVYANLGQLSEAYDQYREAFDLARNLGDEKTANYCQKSMLILDLYNNAKKLRKVGDYEKTVEEFEKAIYICNEINNDILKLKTLRQQSLSYLTLNKLKEFFENNILANKIAKKLNNLDETIFSLINIGHYYSLIDNVNLAIENFNNAVLLATNESLPAEVRFDAYYNAGVINIDIANYDKAIEYFNVALGLMSEDKLNSYYSATLSNLGICYKKRGFDRGNLDDTEKAFSYFSEALTAAEKADNKEFQVAVLNNMGSLKAQMEENLDSLYYLNKARVLAEQLKLNSYLVSIYTNIGIIYSRLGDYQNSSLYYDKAINLALAENENRTLWESYLEKGNLLKKQGKFNEARFYYLNSINIIEGLRSKLTMEEDKASFLGTDKRLDAYQNLVDLLVNINRNRQSPSTLSEAFGFIERAKARAFLDSIESSRTSEEAPANIKLVNQEKEIMSDMSKLYTKLINPELSEEERNNLLKEVKNLEDQLDNVRRQVRSQNPAYANLTYPEIINYNQAQRQFVDAKTAIFNFIVGKESAYAFVLTKKGLKVYPIPAQIELRPKIINHRKAISDTDNHDFHSGQELYELLIRPGLIEGLKNLIIIPDDILNLLPFESLLTSNQSDDWLIKHYNIYYAPSLSSLRELVRHQNRKNRPKAKHNLLAVGDPYYGEFEEKYPELSTKAIFQNFYSLADLKFYRLKYSHEEIKKISNLIPKSTVLEREKATEDLVKSANLSDYKILHFAAHGLIDDQKPARSAIVLTLDNDPTEDGFLQMREVLNLKLNADLVVLSACQTGLGQFIRGEGIESLSRAFFFAGASSVLMSLWTINDQVSSQFMERFYFHLKSGETVAEALRKVKLEMIDSKVVSHPYYWATFILSGDGSSKVFGNSYRTPLMIIASILLGLVISAVFYLRKKSNSRLN